MSETRRESFVKDLVARIGDSIKYGALDPTMGISDIRHITELALMALDQIAPTCLLKADVEEPVFVLRAQDKTFVETIRDWLRRNPNISSQKCATARQDIEAGEKWPIKKQAD